MSDSAVAVDVEAVLAERLRAGVDRSGLAAEARALLPLASSVEVEATVGRLIQRSKTNGPLEALLADPAVTEVMCNGAGAVWVERHGTLMPTSTVVSEADIRLFVERAAAPLGRSVTNLEPILDARLPDGSRLNVVLPPLAVDGPTVTIRKFATRTLPLDAFGPGGIVMRQLVETGQTIVLGGGTSAGKTTLLNSAAACLDPRLRVVTVEDTAELRLPLPHLVRLETRPANADGLGGATMADLVRTALRMRPDRLVVGEVRGSEALDLILALGTGHDGSMATVHARSASGAMGRLETLALLGGHGLQPEGIRRQLFDAVDAVVMVSRQAGVRQIVEIAAVERDSDQPRLVTQWQVST